MKKLLIIFGGQSNESEISIKSATNILRYIDDKKYIVSCTFIDKQGVWYNSDIASLHKGEKIKNIINFLMNFDIVFPIIHGKFGEDGKIQGLLEMAGVNYVGSGLLSSSVGMDKHFSKILCTYLGIPTLPWISIDNKYKIKNIEDTIKYPMIIKPANSGSSIGIYTANNRKELINSIKLAREVDLKVIVEPFIKARELECSILEDRKVIASRVGEIKHNSLFYDFDTKYNNKATKLIIPANISKQLEKKIQKYSKMFFKELGATSFARIDFLLDENNNIYFNEINTIPGFTNQSMYPKLLEKSGYNYKTIISKLLELS